MSGALKRLYRGETKIDFIGKRRIWFAISAVVIALCVLSLATSGLNYGIEFEGGVSIKAPIPPDGPLGDATDIEVIEELRSSLEEFGASGAQIQVAREGDERSVAVQTKEVADPEVQAQVVERVAETVGTELADTDSERIGSKWGAEITRKAVRALVIFVIVIMVFMAWRFEWKMGLAAIVALVHDLAITAGVYSFVGFEVTPSTVIALLTILGYSLYDTVVVFDKVEENTETLATTGKMTYQDAANLSMNQVFMRSLNTSLATLLPVAALLFIGAGLLGAETLKDLALALFVGIATGTYSSIFVATPVLSMWKEREQRFRTVRERVLKDSRKPSRAAVVDSSEGVDEPKEEVVGAAAAATPTRAPSSSRPPARSKVGSKKARRRRRR